MICFKRISLSQDLIPDNYLILRLQVSVPAPAQQSVDLCYWSPIRSGSE